MTVCTLFLLCLGLAFLSGCAKRADTVDRQALRISQRNEPATLDPHLATLPDEFFIIRALSEGLLSPNPAGGVPEPAVAESWKISADGRTYVFQLRAATQWSNGDPVRAGDFVYSIQRALSPQLAAPKAAVFFPLKNAAAYYRGKENDFSQVGARALDDHQLELTLAEPMADFLAVIASGPWLPVHRATIEKFGRIDQRGTAWTAPDNFVGNGPFRLTRWLPNQEIVVQRSPTYRDAAAILLPEIRFLAFDNGDSEERAFRAGQLDVTMDVPFSKLKSYREAPLATSILHNVPLHETRYLTLNTTIAPLNDARVRRALGLALDRQALASKVLQGGQQPAFNFIPGGLGGYQPATLIEENRAEARRLLAEAGFENGAGFPKFEMSTWGSTAVLEAIQQMWLQELGIEVRIARREARTHLAALSSGDYAIAMMTAIPDYDGASDLFSDLLGASPGNFPQWHNAEFDRLVHTAVKTQDAPARMRLYQNAEAVLLHEMPLIPLYFNAQNFLLQPSVKNWRTDRLWTRFYRGVARE